MSRRTTTPSRPLHPLPLSTTLAYGFAAGVVGVTVMTLGEKLEQSFTSRPNSYVPGHTLRKLLGLAPRPDSQMTVFNHLGHWGFGLFSAIGRAMMSAYGIRGPFADFMFTGMRLAVDQTAENATGVGAPPWTWPVNEQMVDLLHKAVYSFVTGYLCDRWIQ